jgi:hypothetical protein
MTYSINRDLDEAEAMAKGLAPYVQGDQLYGSTGGFGFLNLSNMPSLTIGALLLRTRRLHELNQRGDLSDEQAQRLQKILHRNDEVFREWTKAYTDKMMREAESRLKAMQTWFEECFNDPKTCARNYRPEAMRRTTVQELFIAMDEIDIQPDDDLTRLKGQIDAQLRRYANERGEFLLDATLQPVYPEATFWWLYQRPHTPEK